MRSGRTTFERLGPVPAEVVYEYGEGEEWVRVSRRGMDVMHEDGRFTRPMVLRVPFSVWEAMLERPMAGTRAIGVQCWRWGVRGRFYVMEAGPETGSPRLCLPGAAGRALLEGASWLGAPARGGGISLSDRLFGGRARPVPPVVPGRPVRSGEQGSSG